MQTEDKATVAFLTTVILCVAANRFVPEYALRSIARAKARKMKKDGYTGHEVWDVARNNHDPYLKEASYK